MNPTINETVQDFADYQSEKQASAKTVENQVEDLTRFMAFSGWKTLADITPRTFRSFRAREKERGIADTTWNRMATSLRSWLKFLYVECLVDRDMSEAVPRVKEQDAKDIEVVSKADFSRIENYLDSLQDSSLMAAYQNARLRALWSLMARDGLRRDEIHRLDLVDFDELREDNVLRLAGKGARHRDVPLASRTLVFLAAYVKARDSYLQSRGETSPALFVSSKMNRLSNRQLNDLVRDLGLAAQTEAQVSCHKCRKTAVSRAINNLHNLAAMPSVAKSFGHTPDVAHRYYHKPDLQVALAAKEEAERKVA